MNQKVPVNLCKACKRLLTPDIFLGAWVVAKCINMRFAITLCLFCGDAYILAWDSNVEAHLNRMPRQEAQTRSIPRLNMANKQKKQNSYHFFKCHARKWRAQSFYG